MFKISKIEIFKNFLEKERPLNKGILTKLESNLKTNFIYNSNAIEGSTLTLKKNWYYSSIWDYCERENLEGVWGSEGVGICS